MASEIAQTLAGLLDASQAERSKAEDKLKSFENQPGYASELCKIVLGHEFSITIRQLASVTLKQLVKDRWEATEESTALGDNEKSIVRSILPPALGDVVPQIRMGVAMVLARIAKVDWPELWPDLVPNLVAALHSQNENLVHGSVVALSMMIGDDALTDSHLPQLAAQLFPEILNVFRSGAFSEQVRAKAAQIYSDTVNFIALVNSKESIQQKKTYINLSF